MRTVFVSSLILTLGLWTAPRILWAAPSAAERPNVLILHVDQLRFDCLGVYGNPDVKTPNIDRLAADGVRYTNSFCAFPVCTPSRYSLLSGRYVHEHAGWDNRSTLAPQIATFPRLFRAAGYHTKAVGKMHFTPTYLDVGFEALLLAEQDGPGRWDDDYHRYLMQRGLVDRNDLEDQRAEYRRHAPPEYWDKLGALVSNLPEAHHSTTWISRPRGGGRPVLECA
jgi:arylsulfatase A-like enzyme